MTEYDGHKGGYQQPTQGGARGGKKGKECAKRQNQSLYFASPRSLSLQVDYFLKLTKNASGSFVSRNAILAKHDVYPLMVLLT